MAIHRQVMDQGDVGQAVDLLKHRFCRSNFGEHTRYISSSISLSAASPGQVPGP